MQQIISYFQNDSKLFHEFLKKKRPKTNEIKCGCSDNHSCNDTEKQIYSPRGLRLSNDRFNFYSKIGRHIMSPATNNCDNVI